MRLTSKPLAVIIVVVMFGGIFSAKSLGWWQTISTKQVATYAEGDFAGQANPADIRGSYTFGDVENNFGVPAGLLAQAFGVETDDPASFVVKSLEAMYLESPQEVGTASVRLFVAFYLGLPIDLSTDIYLPKAAADVLHNRGLSAEYAAYLEAHQAPDPGTKVAPPTDLAPPSSQPGKPAAVATPIAAGKHTPASATGTIKGKTTFAELMQWGLKAETIEQVLGMSMPAAKGMTVRDFCSQNGLAFETIKLALQAELEKIK